MTRQPERPPADTAAQERVAELIRAVDVQAPERLHARVQQLVAPRERQPTGGLLRARLKPTLVAMAAAAAAGVAIALLTGSGTHSLSVREASVLTLRPATMAAPRESGGHNATLNIGVDGVAFPYWESLRWRSVGARTDTVRGRRVTTVFYEGTNGARVGYAIVSGKTAPATLGALRSVGSVSWVNGVPYHLLQVNGAPAVVWQRDGRLCVLSGRGVSSATLLHLASWDDRQQAV
jgi:hypothetical protein